MKDMNEGKFKLKEGYIYQDLGKDVVIFSSEYSELYTFNETAAIVFKLLMKGQSIEFIINTLRKKYLIKKETVLNDINDLIANLQKNKIIEGNVKISNISDKLSAK